MTALARADCVDEPGRWADEPIAATRTELLRGTERLSVGEEPEGCLLAVVTAVHRLPAALARCLPQHRRAMPAGAPVAGRVIDRPQRWLPLYIDCRRPFRWVRWITSNSSRLRPEPTATQVSGDSARC